jgi:DNA-binding CsgD family transcriptional regulator
VLADRDSSTHARAAAAAVLGLVLALRGHTEPARPILLEGASCAHQGRVLGAQILAAWGLAVLAENTACRAPDLGGTVSPGGPADRAEPAGAGPDDETAVAAARALLDVATGTDECHYSIPSLQWSVVTFGRHGRLAEARRATAMLASIAETVGHGEAYAAWTHAQAEVAWLEQDVEAATSAARQALRLAEGTGVAYSCALLAGRAAEILLRSGQIDTALTTLRSARRTAHRLRALPLLHRIDATLAVHGEAPGLPRRGGQAPQAQGAASTMLTEREAEVMTLVAGGHTSKQIAGRLFLSPRTVDMHVRNSMIKLDSRTRAQAVTRFLS